MPKMELKTVFLALCVVAVLLLILTEITAIANNDNLLIRDDEKRGTVGGDDGGGEQLGGNTYKRGLLTPADTHKHQQYLPGGYPSGGGSYSSYPYGAPSAPAAHSGYDGSNYGYSGPGQYGHSGGGYGGHGDGQVSHQGSHYGYSALALKGLLIPLAGIALLGAAAALSTNPVLLQLGVVNGRKKRSLQHIDKVYPISPKVKPDINS